MKLITEALVGMVITTINEGVICYVNGGRESEKDYSSGGDFVEKLDEGIDAASPRRVIRECQRLGILSSEQTEMALYMSGDRNLTTHIYDEEFAVELSARMKDYGKLLRTWLKKN